MESRRTVISTSSCLPPPAGGRVYHQVGGVITNLTTELVLSSTFYFCLNSPALIRALGGLLRHILMCCVLICEFVKEYHGFFRDGHLSSPRVFTSFRSAVTRTTISRMFLFYVLVLKVHSTLKTFLTLFLLSKVLLPLFCLHMQLCLFLENSDPI